jgi:hypothetical protein
MRIIGRNGFFVLLRMLRTPAGTPPRQSIDRILPNYGKFALILCQQCDIAQKNPLDQQTNEGIFALSQEKGVKPHPRRICGNIDD